MDKLTFQDYKLTDLFQANTLSDIDARFLTFLEKENADLHRDILKYRQNDNSLSSIQESELIIAAGKVLDIFLIDFFAIKDDAEQLELETLSSRPIFAFKKWYVLRRAKRRLMRDEDLPGFKELDDWLRSQLDPPVKPEDDKELAIAEFAMPFLDDKEANEDIIEKITQWCIQAIKTPEGQAATKGWVSFKLPKRTDYQRLIPIIPVKGDKLKREELPANHLRLRDGFKLTDERMDLREVMSEIDYCVYCHKNDGDFCSIGFPEKKGEPDLGFKKNPLDNTLTGCPLDEKISEMHSLKRDAYSIGALATVMIDNPMCPVTGHRICNDCMKACIYQKQTPVDIPQVETRVLTDVLNLTWGVEIYDLLTRWNPLRKTQWVAKPYNGLKLFIAGMGPAGFTLAHHMLMEGFAVVGTDGLKIESLPEMLCKEPIKHFDKIKESLDERIMAGFGGVAEYGITVRWDKNFLKLIYITLMRRPHFQVFGGVRFGGTVTVDDIWDLGFDHAAIAVGAGLPKALPIPGSMATGMRQANDFLMALQLTGAAKADAMANLQLRLPAVVIGGGLTGVDTATEAQAYYIKQVEKALTRYEALIEAQDKKSVRAEFDKEALGILDEFIEHGLAVRKERERAAKAGEQPNFIKLIRKWGGVSILYRRSIQESPAYVSNDAELYKALEEGLYYQEGLQPVEAILDEHAHVKTLVCQVREQDDEGVWHNTDETIKVPARAILVATGAQPNIAYAFEHKDTFKRNGLEYQPYENIDNKLEIVKAAENIKDPNFGPFTSYNKDDKRVTFLGDTHPVFHGNVVSAIASAYRSYPKIMNYFDEAALQRTEEIEYDIFADAMTQRFKTHIKSVTRLNHNTVELEIHAPMAAKKFKPGNFYRIQNYERYSEHKDDTLLQMEPMALYGFDPDPERGTLKLISVARGVSSRICANLKPGEPIAIMGPTGVRSKIPQDQETILIIGNQLSIAYFLATTPALKSAGNRVYFICELHSPDDVFHKEKVEQYAEHVIWATDDKSAITALTALSDECLNNIDRISVIGDTNLLRNFQAARNGVLQNKFKADIKVFGSIYSTMQCMLKGVCAQCLQWQINPETGERTKAVFACSWQDQPLEIVDIDNLDERLGQNRVAEKLSDLWLNHIN